MTAAHSPSSTFQPEAQAETQGIPMENRVATNEKQNQYTVTSPVSPWSGATTANIGTTYVPGTTGIATPSISELPTVYLPPIHYTYDRATGKLVQISRGEKGPMQNAQIPQTANINTNTVYTTVPDMANKPKETVTGVTHATNPPTHMTPRLGQTYNMNVSHIPRTVYTTSENNGNGIPMPQMDFQPMQTHVYPQTIPMQQQQPMTNIYPYGTQFVPLGAAESPIAGGMPGHPIMRSYAAPMQGQYNLEQRQMVYPQQPERTSHQHERQHTSSFVNNVASSMKKTYDTAAKAFTSFDDPSFGNIAQNIQSVIQPNAAEHTRAVSFKLQRLENVPQLNPSSSRASYSVVAYFDTTTENYDVYRSGQHWAIPSDRPNAINCDLGGDAIRIPWQGEEHVYLKIVEHINQLETLVGRLKLHIESLVRQHPLRINIISDANTICGNVILEFNIGHMSHQEVRVKQEEALRTAEIRRATENQYRSNRMPDYDTYMQQHRRMQRDRMAAEYGYNKTGYSPRASPPTLGDVKIPAALHHFVRWCCDITDKDFY